MSGCLLAFSLGSFLNQINWVVDCMRLLCAPPGTTAVCLDFWSGFCGVLRCGRALLGTWCDMWPATPV